MGARYIGKTSESFLDISDTKDIHRSNREALFFQTPPLLTTSPEWIAKTRVFGDFAPLSEDFIEKHGRPLKETAEFLIREREYCKWYSFLDYGDMVHSYDPKRDIWRRDEGGYAWNNNEHCISEGLWTAFLHSGDIELFHLAEDMTRHLGDVDMYHMGPLMGNGTRHNVNHYGCNCKKRRRTLGEKVGYLIYLPPSYEHEKQKRFPVIYWLHGVRGGLLKSSIFYRRYLDALNNSKAPEEILVFPKGRHDSSYCDSINGTRPVETVIIKELIPHIDQTYRTIASRQGCAVEGSSMGGFGALHLGFKYPEVFGVVTSLSAAISPPEEFKAREKERAAPQVQERQSKKKKSRPNLFVTTFGGSMDYARINSP